MIFGVSGGLGGLIWRVLEAKLEVWRHLGGILEALGGSGRHLGGSRRHLGGSWAALGRILEPKLEDLEAILGGLGGQVGGLEANLDASWSQVGRFLGHLGCLGGNLR